MFESYCLDGVYPFGRSCLLGTEFRELDRNLPKEGLERMRFLGPAGASVIPEALTSCEVDPDFELTVLADSVGGGSGHPSILRSPGSCPGRPGLAIHLFSGPDPPHEIDN